nr:MAG TPA: hypothetical protein [Caudoviricetes sp.]
MIECRLGENTKDRYIKINGDLAALEMDLVTLINSIYNSISKHSPEAAENFADTFPRALEMLKDEIFGPEIMEGVLVGTVIKKRKEEAADD